MTRTPHELADEFPRDIEVLRYLGSNDLHFVELAENYSDLNRQIGRIESRIESASPRYAEMLRAQRLCIVDEIACMVAALRSHAA